MSKERTLSRFGDSDRKEFEEFGALMVIPIDCDKLAKHVAKELNEQLPETKNYALEISEKWALIKAPNGKTFLMDSEAGYYDDNGEPYPMRIRRKSEKKTDEEGNEVTQFYMFAVWDFEIPLKQLMNYTLPEITVEKFMGDRYLYNERIASNMKGLMHDYNEKVKAVS